MSERWWCGKQWYGMRNYHESSNWSQSEWWWKSPWSNDPSSSLPYQKSKKSVTFQIEPVHHSWVEEDMVEEELRKSVKVSNDVEIPPRRGIFVAIFRKTLLASIRKTNECFLTRAQLTSIRDSTQSEFLEAMLERERKVLSVPWCTKKRRVITWDYQAQTCQEVEEVWNEPIQNYY